MDSALAPRVARFTFEGSPPPDLDRITVEAGKLGGRPCVRRMRIGVSDVLGMLAGGMTAAEILDDFPDLEAEDLRACLAFAAQAVDARALRSP